MRHLREGYAPNPQQRSQIRELLRHKDKELEQAMSLLATGVQGDELEAAHQRISRIH